MAKRIIPQDTECFKYHNENPSTIHTSDCVVRSLSLAMGKDWDSVYRDLCRLGIKMKQMPNERKVWETYLDDNGWVRKKQPKKRDGTKYKGSELAKVVKSSRIIIASIGVRHLSVIKEKRVWDIWDCSERCVGIYFEKQS